MRQAITTTQALPTGSLDASMMYLIHHQIILATEEARAWNSNAAWGPLTKKDMMEGPTVCLPWVGQSFVDFFCEPSQRQVGGTISHERFHLESTITKFDGQ